MVGRLSFSQPSRVSLSPIRTTLVQLRGLVLEDADAVMEGLVARGLSSVMSGMDNVRNITGSPIAGIDPHALIDSRPLCHGAPSGAWGCLRR